MSKRSVLFIVFVLVVSLMATVAFANNAAKKDAVQHVSKKALPISKGLAAPSVDVVYSTDFETEGEWASYQLGTTGAVFEWVEDESYSPSHSWHCADDAAMTAEEAVPISAAIVSPVITLPTSVDGGPVTKILFSYWFRANFPNTNEDTGVYDVWQAEIFVPYEGDNFWHTNEYQGFEGKSWWCADPDNQNGITGTYTYGANWRQELWTPTIDLTAADGPVMLTFKNAPNSEPGYDYCVLEISNNGGASWDRLGIWDEEHDPVEYFDESYDISAWATDQVIVRWRFEADGGTESVNAWHIDNVEIKDNATTYVFDDGGDTAEVLVAQEHPKAWVRLQYDYNPDRFLPVENWYQETDDTIYNGTLNLLDYAGMDVQVRMRVSTDGWNRLGVAPGFGFYVDDVLIEAVGKPGVDIGVSGVVGTLNAGLNKPWGPTVFLKNEGMDTLSGNLNWFGSINDATGKKLFTLIGTTMLEDFASDETIGVPTLASKYWTPTMPGEYSLDIFMMFQGDEYPLNDSLSTTFIVHGAPFSEKVYGEDFEAAVPMLSDFGFTVVNNGGDAEGNNNNTWVWPDAWIYGGAPGISGYFSYASLDEALDEELISPAIDISGVGKHNTLYLQNYIYFRPGHASLPAPFGIGTSDLSIEYSTDAGASWNQVWYWVDDDGEPGDYNRWPQTRLGIPYYVMTTIDLSDAIGADQIWLRYHVTAENSAIFGISVDEIMLYKGFGAPIITGVADVNPDQGKQVDVTWKPSFNDLTVWDESGEEHIVTQYSVWDVIPEGEALAANGGVKVVNSKRDMCADLNNAKPGDVYQITGGPALHFQGVVPAVDAQMYSFTAKTHFDEMETWFVVIAHAENPMYFAPSKPVSGMSTDDLAPGSPMNLAASLNDRDITLVWDASYGEEVNVYTVYRDGEKLAETTDLTFAEKVLDGTYTYTVSATDYAGNESELSNEAVVEVTTAVDDFLKAVPTDFAMYQNYPNPFNPETVINYSIPQATYVTIKVYNAAGQEIATLVNGQMAAGNYKAIWNAANVSTGIYFYSIQAADYSKTMKMILMK